MRGLKGNPESARLFVSGGKALEIGQVFRNPDMGKPFRLIAEPGAKAVSTRAKSPPRSSKPRSIWVNHDGPGFSVVVRRLGGTALNRYRGWKVYELPPNGQGIAAPEKLTIIENTPPSLFGPLGADKTHKTNRGYEASVF